MKKTNLIIDQPTVNRLYEVGNQLVIDLLKENGLNRRPAEKFLIGEWIQLVDTPTTIVCITKLGDCYEASAFGFSGLKGDWENDSMRSWSFGDNSDGQWRKADPKDVERAMVKYAISQNYTPHNHYCLRDCEDGVETMKEGIFYWNGERMFTSDQGGGGTCVFEHGKWANPFDKEEKSTEEIVEEYIYQFPNTKLI